MKTAVDLDVLVAAFGPEGIVRRLLVLGEGPWVTVEGAFATLGEHLPLLAARIGCDAGALEQALAVLETYVEEVPFETYADAYTGLELSYPWANVREVDLLALASAADCRIWSENEAFDQASDLDVVRTEDVFGEVVR